MAVPRPSSTAYRALISWTFYDWGANAFLTVIQTFVFATYFVNKVSFDHVIGAATWGLITGITGLIIAVISPFLGAAADQGGRRKLWLASFTILCIFFTSLLWFIKPLPEYTWPAILMVGIAIIGSETAYLFYNAMLPELAPPNQIGRWSGFGWGMGYAGGTVALIASLELFINANSLWAFLGIPIDQELFEPIRATFILAAIWYAVFSLPVFIFTPPSPHSKKTLIQAAIAGMHQLRTTLSEIRRYSNIVRFLIARLFYVDGIATLVAFGGIYAAAVFAMTDKEVLQFGISLNITAGIGAATFAFFDDRFGSKRMILLSLLGLIIPGTLAIIVVSKWQFWILGLLLGIFIGPVQASSRSLMARIAPPHLRNEMFGFYVLSGKATAFLGPFLYSGIAFLTGSLRWGMSSVVLLFLLGGLLMLTVSEKKP